jgi:hypothetical protein
VSPTVAFGSVREIVVTGEDFSELDGAEALSGKVVAVARSTGCYESLTKLNERLTAQGQAARHYHHRPRHAGGRGPDGR